MNLDFRLPFSAAGISKKVGDSSPAVISAPVLLGDSAPSMVRVGWQH